MYETKAIFTDSAAVTEALLQNESYWKMSVIKNEDAFLEFCDLMEKLCGKTDCPKRAEAIIADRRLHQYFDLAITFIQESKYTLFEVNSVLKSMLKNMKYVKNVNTIDGVFLLINKWLPYIGYEPIFHQNLRNDKSKLSNSSKCNMWSFLRGMYTDPEYSKLRVPDAVAARARNTPKFTELLNKARTEGQAELKRLYGQDVDLSLQTDKTKRASEAEIDFMKQLQDGEIGKMLNN